MPPLSFLFAALLLSGCESRESAEELAKKELQKYCEETKADCSNTRLNSVQPWGMGWFFDYTISEKPEHLVAIMVSPLGGVELTHMRDDQ
ncbi:MAG: hypothetical protein E6Q98_18730 [Rhodospirillaceae bacterium]|nr:MAG: hypothetical protein E6Q98_18730 [Rhodospirillaceae bacterium]